MLKKLLSIIFIFLMLSGCSGDMGSSKLELLSFKDTSMVSRSNLKRKIKESDQDVFFVEDDHQLDVEAVVKNTDRLSFIDMVIYVSFLNTSVVFNEGHGDYICSTTTVLDGDLWVTKINFSIDTDLEVNKSGYIEVKEINFLDLNSEKAGANLTKIKSKKINYHKHYGNNIKIVLPTCVDEGYDEYTCEFCDNIVRENIVEIDPTGHVVENGVCKYCGIDEIYTKLKIYDLKISTYDIQLDELLLKQIEEFEKEVKNIDFNVTIENYPYSEVRHLDESEQPDLVVLNDAEIPSAMRDRKLVKVKEDYVDELKSSTIEQAINNASLNNEMYAYPITLDNGYFMYYNKKAISEEDAKSLDSLIATCEENNKYFSFPLESNVWYTMSPFFGTGCEFDWQINEDGEYINAENNFNSDKGLKAAKTVKKIINSKSYDRNELPVNQLSAIVSGTWMYEECKRAWGSNLEIVELPAFEVDGESYHLGSFSTGRLLGVIDKGDEEKIDAVQQLAMFLASKKCQEERAKELDLLPCNLEAMNCETVINSPVLSALKKQQAYSFPQGSLPDVWWQYFTTIIFDIKEANNDEEIMIALAKFETQINSLK